MRAVVAPMMADRTFYQAVPGLLDALPDAERRDAEAVAVEPFEASLAAWNRALRSWPFSRDRVRLALAPTIPHHCSEAFLKAAKEAAAEHGVGFPHPSRRIEGAGPCRGAPLRHDADRVSRPDRRPRSGLHRRACRVGWTATTCAASPMPAARSRTIPAPMRASAAALRRRGRCWMRACGSGSAPMPAPARTISTCSRRCASRPWSRACRSWTRSAGCLPTRC